MRAALLCVAVSAYVLPSRISRLRGVAPLRVATEDPATVADDATAPKKSSLRAAPARPGARKYPYRHSKKRTARAPAVEGGPAPTPSTRLHASRRETR